MTDEIVKRRTVLPGALLEEVADEIQVAEADVYEFLAFTLAEEYYALPLRTVREILKMQPVTEVPRALADVLGIISVRGLITTVVDLRRRLRMPEQPITKHTRILLVDQGEEVLGLLVDSVLSVFRLRQDEVELAAAAGGDTADYVLGIGRPTGGRSGTRAGGRIGERGLEREDDILILLDPKALLKR